MAYIRTKFCLQIFHQSLFGTGHSSSKRFIECQSDFTILRFTNFITQLILHFITKLGSCQLPSFYINVCSEVIIIAPFSISTRKCSDFWTFSSEIRKDNFGIHFNGTDFWSKFEICVKNPNVSKKTVSIFGKFPFWQNFRILTKKYC